VTQLVQVPVAEAGPPADPGEPVRHVVRVQWRPQGAWKDQVAFPPGWPDCDPLLGQTSAVAPQQLVIATPSGVERFFEQCAEPLPGPLDMEALAAITEANWSKSVGPPLGVSDPL
jgi:hypothetical protein